MKIGKYDTDQDVLVIAEIGNNHEGDFDLAQRLVRKAKACGVHGVKFQTFRSEHYRPKSNEAGFKRIKGFELTPDQFRELADLAHSLDLLFLSTPFDLYSAELLCEIADGVKIASGDNDFYPLLDRVAQGERPVILSTGAADSDKVGRAVECIRRGIGATPLADRLMLLHCTVSYPAPPESANLLAIPALQAQFRVPIGFSDHTIGSEACALAVALGARMLEKHFTVDKLWSDFGDHQVSADPPEMKALVERVRATRTLLGSGVKSVLPAEQGLLVPIRRSICAAAALPAGHVLSLDDLTWIRPGGGMAPGREGELVGRRLKRPVEFGLVLSPDHVE